MQAKGARAGKSRSTAAGAQARVLRRLRASRKYGALAVDTLRWASQWALERSKSERNAEKLARRKLHQIFGAYVDPGAKRKLTSILQSALLSSREGTAGNGVWGTDPRLIQASREAMRLHASMRERLLEIESFYLRILDAIGASPKSVLDLACGLGPLALPWMHLPEGCEYVGFDIDKALLATLRPFVRLLNPHAKLFCRDVLRRPPTQQADIAFLLKSLPCMEQQSREATEAMIRRLRVCWIVVSYPTRSLGRRSKGMREHYADRAARLLGGVGLYYEMIQFETELVFVARPRALHGHAGSALG